MMHYYDYPTRGDYGLIDLFCWLLWLVVFIDLVLLGVWLWQHISKK